MLIAGRVTLATAAVALVAALNPAPAPAVAAGPGQRPGPGSTPREAALAHRAEYAPAYGVDPSDLSVARVWHSAGGGSVVHLRQSVDGLPVLGGEMVMDLDGGGEVRSVEAELTRAHALAAMSVPAARATATARAAVAKAEQRPAGELTAADAGRWLYDPRLLGVAGGLGARPVWRVEVTDGAAVRESVLVDAASGRVLLRLDEAMPVLDRQVCDAQDKQDATSDCAYAPYPARTETGPESAVADVNDAWELTGATAQMYADVAGLDLTQLIGSGGGSYPKKLSSWVRWCATPGVDPTCPMANAFWSGNQMYFGDGYAGADDVVGHEMTHGVIEHFSDLFYFHQSGAINESLADVMGEVLDHRHASPADAPDDWQLGEDLPGGAIRDLADPTRFGQPDRMTSPLYDADPDLLDNGGVHTDSGVGNKTAYLISQGGTFNGQTVTGIDAGDPTLTRTATLYTEVIKRLSSGAGYAELADVLEQACGVLATAGTAGFTADDCVQVAAATTATELRKSPTVPGASPLPDVATTCPSGTEKLPLFSNAGTLAGLSTASNTLWTTAPDTTWGVPSNARTGTSSLFAFDPDPGNFGDPSSSSVTMTTPVEVPSGQSTYLAFDQWRLFEWTNGQPATYQDGGQVTVWATDDSGAFVRQTLPDGAWDNGPSEPLALGDPANPVPGFGGDSHGWTSSRLDLSSLAGRQVKVSWTVRGDASGSAIGWFLDNPQVYSCRPLVAPGKVARFETAPGYGPSVRLTWEAPTALGSGLTGYAVTRSDGTRRVLSASATAVTERDLAAGTTYTFTIRALGRDGLAGGSRSRTVHSPKVKVTAPPSTVRKGTTLTFAGTVFAVGTTTPAAGDFVTLQWHRPGATVWRSTLPDGGAVYAAIGKDGHFRLRAVADRTLVYRVVMPPYAAWFAGRSTTMKVRVPT